METELQPIDSKQCDAGGDLTRTVDHNIIDGVHKAPKTSVKIDPQQPTHFDEVMLV